MNKRFWIFGFIGLAIFAFTRIWPERTDARTITLAVPEMANERDVRIITNAALEEVAGHLPQHIHATKIDFGRRLVVYQEGADLAAPARIGRILASLAEAGYPATIDRVIRNPPPVAADRNGRPYSQWPDRHSVFLHVDGLKTNLDANRITAALTLARTGDLPRFIAPDPASRTITIRYETRLLGAENIRQSITASGYTAGSRPAANPPEATPPHGWTRLEAGDV